MCQSGSINKKETPGHKMETGLGNDNTEMKIEKNI